MLETMKRWQNKVAVVTGASAGIGRAIALELAGANLRVVLLARRKAQLESLREEIAARGGEALCIPADLGAPAEIASAFESIRKTWGGVDVLVNNAGLGFRQGVLDANFDRLQAMMDINQRAVLLAIREAVKDMRKREEGAIVNISSTAAHRIPPVGNQATLYAATKWGLRAMTEGIRQEIHAQGWPIKIGSVSPGLVASEFHQVANPKGENPELPFEPLQPEAVANAVLYMLAVPPQVDIGDIIMRSIQQPV